LSRGLLIGLAIVCASADLRALKVELTRTDIERALTIARWPRSDADRAQFHARYIVPVNRPPVDSWIVEQVEVVTEFRRIEQMAEEHARVNDLWGRAGIGEVEQAIRPWRGRVSIVVRLALRASGIYIGGVPPVDVIVGGPDEVPPLDVRRTDRYANCGGSTVHCPVIGGLVEHIVGAAATGQTTRTVRVVLAGKELAAVTVDFGALD
jgi:hypothetical protein